VSDSDLKIKFGKFTLHIGFKTRFAGNAYFNHRKTETDEYKEVCTTISNNLHKDYYDQKGKGKRVWKHLNENDIKKLKDLGASYTLNIEANKNITLSKTEVLAEEVTDPNRYVEGATKKISINVYERNTAARNKCIEHYGDSCTICDFNFGNVFGELGQGYIHVHHLKPLSEIGESYNLDPINDLRPVCPNCHSMLHRQVPALSIETLLKLKKS